MIKIDPYFKDEPKELWQEAAQNRNKSKDNPDRKSKIDLALSQKSTHKFDRTVYGSTVVKDRLKIIFHHKCAFCETNTSVGAHKDVEHFRFKTHYYWLGYEWTNLLLSCQICNRDFKKIEFPLLNVSNRVKWPMLKSDGTLNKTACHIKKLNAIEKPLLIHPAIDNPVKHIRFKPNGSIEGMTNRGEKSIEVYGLDRPTLIKARKEIVLKIVKFIVTVYKMNIEALDETSKQTWMETVIKKAINHLKSKIANKDVQYIGFRQAILKDFEAFIIDNTNKEINDLIPDKDIMRRAVWIVLNQ